MNDELKKEIVTLVEEAKISYVSSIDENGYPNTKAMMALMHDGMKTHYFSTNLSVKKLFLFD